MFCLCPYITITHDERVKVFIPLLWSLLQPIQTLFQLANHVLLPFDFKFFWLNYADFFLQFTLERQSSHLIARAQDSNKLLNPKPLEIILKTGENVSLKLISFF